MVTSLFIIVITHIFAVKYFFFYEFMLTSAKIGC